MERKLTVILSADVVGYSGLMERDEAGTLTRLKENRANLFDPRVMAHAGRIFKLMGDGVLIEFPSAVSAVTCALEIQEAMDTAEASTQQSKRLSYRIGINLGDVFVDGDDMYGDGVNLAARLQALAPVGGIALSRNVSDQIAGKIGIPFQDLGLHTVKNITRPVHVFAWSKSQDAIAKVAAAATAHRVSICVLPFANMSGDVEQEYFSDGISEDIITDLARVSALSVVSRNTAFTFKGRAHDIAAVTRQLNVTHVLEGSVRKSGKRVRIAAQLIDGKTDAHIWAERWDRDLDDIFALQDEISQAIVAALRLKLLPQEKTAIERRGTNNTEAFNTYLMARNAYMTSNMTDVRRAETVVRLCRRAIELDPAYAHAWAMLALAQRALSYAGEKGDSGLAAAERALELDPSIVDAHGAHIGALAAAQQYDKARDAIDLALGLDPSSYEVNKEAGRVALLEHRYKDAIGYYEKSAAAVEEDFSSAGMLMTCYAALNDKVGVRRAAERVLTRTERILAADPNNGSALGMGIGALAALGETARAKEWTSRALIVDPDNLNMRYNIACAFILDLNDIDTALDLLEPVLANFGRDRLALAQTDTDLDAVRTHPRFQAMLQAAEARVAGAAPQT